MRCGLFAPYNLGEVRHGRACRVARGEILGDAKTLPTTEFDKHCHRGWPYVLAAGPAPKVPGLEVFGGGSRGEVYVDLSFEDGSTVHVSVVVASAECTCGTYLGSVGLDVCFRFLTGHMVIR